MPKIRKLQQTKGVILDMINYTQKHPKHKKLLAIRWDEKSVQTAVEMRKSGYSVKQIAKVLCVTPQRVGTKLRDLGIKKI